MVTLVKRATPTQLRLIKIVRGAIKQSTMAHPELAFDPRLTDSIVKRIVGMLSASSTLTVNHPINSPLNRDGKTVGNLLSGEETTTISSPTDLHKPGSCKSVQKQELFTGSCAKLKPKPNQINQQQPLPAPVNLVGQILGTMRATRVKQLKHHQADILQQMLKLLAQIDNQDKPWDITKYRPTKRELKVFKLKE